MGILKHSRPRPARRHATAEAHSTRGLRHRDGAASLPPERAPDCVITIDHQGRIIEFTPAAQRLFGFPRKDARGRDLGRLILAPSGAARLRRALAGVASKRATRGGPLTLRARRSDGTGLSVEVAIARLPSTVPPMFAALVHDLNRPRGGGALAKLSGNVRLSRAPSTRRAEIEVLPGLIRRVHAARLPVEIYSIICEQALSILRGDHAEIDLLDPARGLMMRVHAAPAAHPAGREFPVAGSLCEPAIKRATTLRGTSSREGQRRPERAHDEHLGPYAITPLGSAEEVIGTLLLARRRGTGRPFTDKEIRLLESIAEVGGTAIRRAQLYQDLQRQVERLQAFFEISRRLRAAQMPDEMYLILGKETKSLLGAAYTMLALVSPDGATFTRVFSEGPGAVPPGATFPVEGSRAGEVFKSGTPYVTDDVLHAPLAPWMKAARYEEVGPWVIVPLRSEEGHIGVLSVRRRRDAGRPFTDEEVRVLESIAEVGGTAIRRAQLYEDLQRQATHDALTGLPNRVLYEDRFRQAVAEAARDGRMVGLLMIDLNRFKRVNDTLGHAVGDQLLIEAARRFQQCIRPHDTLARWGGDEFTAILTGLRTAQEAAPVAERLTEAIRQPIQVAGHELFLTATIGISLFPTDSPNPEELLRQADTAMYRATEGKNTYAFFRPTMGDAMSDRLKIENDLRRALDRGEFELHYQPVVELASGALAAAEALVRWNHPELGVVPASRFISIAEDSGLIVPIGGWMLEEACRRFSTWQRSGLYRLPRIAVNISYAQFRRSDFMDRVVGALEKAGVGPEFLEVELVESLVIHDVDKSVRQLKALRALGVTIVLDDFGTGYSSLSYLQRLPIDGLKIAQPFVQGIEDTETTRPLVQAIVAVSRSLRISVTAEGVETPNQLAYLRRLACDKAQGYLLGQPQPAGEFESLLRGVETPII